MNHIHFNPVDNSRDAGLVTRKNVLAACPGKAGRAPVFAGMDRLADDIPGQRNLFPFLKGRAGLGSHKGGGLSIIFRVRREGIWKGFTKKLEGQGDQASTRPYPPGSEWDPLRSPI